MAAIERDLRGSVGAETPRQLSQEDPRLRRLQGLLERLSAYVNPEEHRHLTSFDASEIARFGDDLDSTLRADLLHAALPCPFCTARLVHEGADVVAQQVGTHSR